MIFFIIFIKKIKIFSFLRLIERYILRFTFSICQNVELIKKCGIFMLKSLKNATKNLTLNFIFGKIV